MIDIQEMFDNAIKAKRFDEMQTSEQLTIEVLILKLEAIKDKELPVVFDVEPYKPTGMDSWRGSYREMSLNYEGAGSYYGRNLGATSYGYEEHERISTKLPKNVRVEDLLNKLKECIGKTFQGYKGGDFTMGKQTPVWVANYGDSSGFRENGETAVVGLEEKADKVIILTKVMEY